MTQLAIEALLRQKIGLDPPTLGGTITRAIRQRMADCGLTDMQTYLTRLQISNQELDALIETVVVPETWFFRYPEAFVFLRHYVISKWLPTHPNAVLRVLSLPCSTGEEPYSIAMTLIEAGLSTKNFSIDAVDISKKSIQKANLAVYGRNSFRGEDLAYRERYFTRKVNEYQLHNSVSNTVNFLHGNLLDAHLLKHKHPYDVIFCRNLLIYFDSATREQVLQVLERLLIHSGLLFVGHSETGQILKSRFVPVKHPLAFVYHKIEQKNNIDLKDKSLQKMSLKLDIKRNSNGLVENYKAVKSQNMPQTEESLIKLKIQNSSKLLTSNLENARSLADCGQLNEAATLCQTYLNQNPTNAEAYVLLGQLRQAAGFQEQAMTCFQKAIYLEPNHYQALIHLALLKEQCGDITKAAFLRQRIEKLQNFTER